jgi:hypothetical protein
VPQNYYLIGGVFMDCRTFCRKVLKETMLDCRVKPLSHVHARAKGFWTELPSKGAGKGSDKWWVVKDAEHDVVWTGWTCCSYMAKAKAIGSLINKVKEDKKLQEKVDKMFDLSHLLKRGAQVRRADGLRPHDYIIMVGDVRLGYSVRINLAFEVEVNVTVNRYSYHTCKLTDVILEFFNALGDLAFKANDEAAKFSRVAAGQVFDHDLGGA